MPGIAVYMAPSIPMPPCECVLLDSLYEACIHEWFARRADALPVPIDHSLNPNHVHAGTAYACDSWLSPERHARGAGGKDTPRGERR